MDHGPVVKIGKLMILGSKYNPYNKKFGGKEKKRKKKERVSGESYSSSDKDGHHSERHAHRHKERTRSPRREERRLAHLRENATPQNMGLEFMSQALNQIPKSPFFEEIESLDLPQRFVSTTFVIYNGKFDPVEHVSHLNQSLAL